jgi:RNA polymerase sigma-70 factor (ECF subfamily)
MLDHQALTLPSDRLQSRRTDWDLARAAQGGDLDAFERLVVAYQRRVFGLAYQHLHDVDEAQDLAQEVFVRLYRNLVRYDAERPFEPWFWRLAGNVAATYRRRRPAPAFELPPDAAASPQADRLSLELAIASLDEGLRLPLLLHYHADLPLEDVAAALDLSVGAVKSRLHRARVALRRLLADDAA